MKFAERKVIISPLDPVPPALRFSNGIIVVTSDEYRGLLRGDVLTQKKLTRAISQNDRRTLKKHLQKIGGNT